MHDDDSLTPSKILECIWYSIVERYVTYRVRLLERRTTPTYQAPIFPTVPSARLFGSLTCIGIMYQYVLYISRTMNKMYLLYLTFELKWCPGSLSMHLVSTYLHCLFAHGAAFWTLSGEFASRNNSMIGRPYIPQ